MPMHLDENLPIDYLKAEFRKMAGTVRQYGVEHGRTYDRYCALWWELCERGCKADAEQIDREEYEEVLRFRNSNMKDKNRHWEYPRREQPVTEVEKDVVFVQDELF